MKDKGKRSELEVFNNGDFFGENNNPCKKHPSSSSLSGGICAYCLSDRLVQLVCPQCGEKRLSCSCFELITSNSNSSVTDNVAKISSLIENEKGAKISTSKWKFKTEQKSPSNANPVSNLKRSNSISELVDVNTNRMRKSDQIGKFWKISRLFRKKRENSEEKYECINGVSRSRSVCSFKRFYDTEESGGFPVISSATARASSVSTENFVLDSAKRSCFSESEARISNFDYCDGFFNGPFNKHNIFSLKETEFTSCDDNPGFIDLKLHENMISSDHSKMTLPLPLPLPPSLAGLKRGGLGLSTNNGGSCRISSVSERELRKCRKSYKVWRWFFRQHTSDGNNFGDHGFK